MSDKKNEDHSNEMPLQLPIVKNNCADCSINPDDIGALPGLAEMMDNLECLPVCPKLTGSEHKGD